MKIAIIGYGKMGRLIKEMAKNRGHEIIAIVDVPDWDSEIIKLADVAIEFTTPESVVKNINICLDNGVPIVVGTTGWYQEYDSVSKKCTDLNGALLTATNFSLGVNIFYEINKKLASLMNPNIQYNATINEIHHTQKLDSPSGTAISIAQDMINEIDRYNNWEEADQVKDDVVCIKANREPEVPGTHLVEYESKEDKIIITHEAKNRNGFALGAIIAAEFLVDKQGVFTMNEVLGI